VDVEVSPQDGEWNGYIYAAVIGTFDQKGYSDQDDKDVPMVGAFPVVMTGPINLDALQWQYVWAYDIESGSIVSGQIREYKKMYASRK
jgi:hypothetical protein